MSQHLTSHDFHGAGRPVADVDVTAAVAVTPTDRVRWASVIAGLFAAMTALIVLTVLGIAVGLTAYDPGDRASGFGLGAGVWAAISALIAFGIGGCVAARTSAVRGSRNGLLNGAMVWTAAIPLLLFALGGGLASMIGTATTTASRVADDASVQFDGATQASAGQPAGGQSVVDQAQDVAASVQQQIKPSDVQAAKGTATRAAWGTLVSLMLGFAAAAGGGYLGARKTHADREHDREHRRDEDRPASAT